MDVNFYSLLHTIQVALPELRKSEGSIVLVSSGAAEYVPSQVCTALLI